MNYCKQALQTIVAGTVVFCVLLYNFSLLKTLMREKNNAIPQMPALSLYVKWHSTADSYNQDAKIEILLNCFLFGLAKNTF